MKQHINSQGGSLHVVMTIILVVALLAALGFIFWQNFMQEDAKQPATYLDNIKQQDETGATYLKIKEWGVELPLTDEIDDATYVVKPADWEGAENVEVAELSTKLLDETDPVCEDRTPDNITYSMVGPFQSIERTDDASYVPAEVGNAATIAELTGENEYVKKVGDYYYRFTHGNGDNCFDPEGKILVGYQAAFKGIQPISE